MKKGLILFIALVLSLTGFSQKRKKFKYWEDMSEKEKKAILSDTLTSKNIIELYNGVYKFGDEESSHQLFKQLTSNSEHNAALRFYIYNKLITSGDTSLTKYFRSYTVKMFYNQTDVVVNYLTSTRVNKNNVYLKYVPPLATDLDERIEFQNFTYYLTYYFDQSSADTKSTLRLLFKELSAAGAGKKDPGK